MRFALEKNSATYQPWSQKRQKQTPRKRVGEEIASHMLHIPSKPPQFWSADFLQNYPLVTSNAGLNLIERPRDETLVTTAIFLPCQVQNFLNFIYSFQHTFFSSVHARIEHDPGMHFHSSAATCSSHMQISQGCVDGCRCFWSVKQPSCSL